MVPMQLSVIASAPSDQNSSKHENSYCELGGLCLHQNLACLPWTERNLLMVSKAINICELARKYSLIYLEICLEILDAQKALREPGNII